MMYDETLEGYVFRQSWLGDYMLCPERARLSAFSVTTDPYDGSDATAMGSAAHATIEHFLQGGSWEAALDAGQNYLKKRIEDGDFRWIQTRNPKILYRNLRICCEGWLQSLYPLIDAPDPERGIEHTFLHQIDHNKWLAGTWDYLDAYGLLWDWKTAGGNFKLNYGPKALDKKIQPTVYTAVNARWHRGSSFDYDAQPWRYGIMVKGTKPQAVHRDTIRHVGHWEFLCQQLDAIIKLYETVGPNGPWPLHDNEWHCSPEWCDHWAVCKGAALTIRKRNVL